MKCPIFRSHTRTVPPHVSWQVLSVLVGVFLFYFPVLLFLFFVFFYFPSQTLDGVQKEGNGGGRLLRGERGVGVDILYDAPLPMVPAQPSQTGAGM